ncbi:MAG: putative molybdenum carrier protein [Bacteroidales bacterium]|nr:putative molybdenum carrier protein [Bacteroidales bacterium]
MGRQLSIYSGGQTGVDRAALDAAIECGLWHGGWCPQGRLAEDGIIPRKYRLKETREDDYEVRTELNVNQTNGTLILIDQDMDEGTELTMEICESFQRPYLISNIDLISLEDLESWVDEYQITSLNIAGPRESSEPGIYSKAVKKLTELLGQLTA